MNLTATLPTGNAPPEWAPPTEADGSGGAKRSSTGLKVMLTLAVVALAIAAFVVSSLALFTDTANIGSNTFSTGTVDIATAPASAAFTPPPMAPGDEVVAEIDVQNNGTLDLRYAVTSTTTEDVLASTLVLTVRAGVTDCSVANWDATGSVIAAADVLGRTTTEPVFGNVASGAQAGDRTLAASASELLCFHVELPSATGNGSQGLTTTATFNFVAEQTRNN